MARQHVDKVNQANQGHTRPPISEQQPSDTHVVNPEHESILQMQRLVGNQATQRLMSGGLLQTKMDVSTPGDQYEQEADQVAHQVMTMPDPVQREEVKPADEDELLTKRMVQREEVKPPDEDELLTKPMVQREEAKSPDEDDLLTKPMVQREEVKPADDEDLLTKPMVQRDAASADVPTVTPDVESQIEQGRGSGQAMPDSAQNFFNSRFDQDFSSVRIHTGEQANNLNQTLQARAFTNQSDIYFREGEYQPDSSSGRELLAHELTHVVQQGGA